ncbi:hypothetical protein NM897_17110 (plasmid) [Planococcus maritimus]|uniref:hypothetical protein n=1 Tax=Planococcus maritimus TaxID=192421 RepID=UPI0031396475
MPILFQRHEPAKQNNDNFGWIRVIDNEYDFIGNEPKGITDINRYLVEKDNLLDFISEVSQNSIVYSCISLGQKSRTLTKTQLFLLKKKIISKGWSNSKNIKIPQVFLREAINIELNQVEVLENHNLDSLLLICKDFKKEEEILSLLGRVDLLNQPVDLGHYFPTEVTLKTLLKERIGIAFLQPYYYEEDITANERTILVYYSPWNERYF